MALILKYLDKENSYLTKDEKVVVFESLEQAQLAIVRLYDTGYIHQNDVRYISVHDVEHPLENKINYTDDLF